MRRATSAPSTGVQNLDGFNMHDVAPWAWTGGAGFLGRLMYHAKQAQLGKRRFFSLAMLLDLPIALGMGWVMYGFTVWFKLPMEVTISAAIIGAYIGPRGVDQLFERWQDKQFGKEGDA